MFWFWFGWFPGPRSLKTRAQYKSNNHLTDGTDCTLWIREAVTPSWGFWGNLGSIRQYGLMENPTQMGTSNPWRLVEP